MVRADNPQGIAQYRFDALSLRSHTYLFESGSFRPLALHEQDNTQTGGNTYHYHLDHLGTPRELTDSQGQIVWSARYRAYGNLALADVEAIDNPLRFQGQYFDAETGLHYNLNRYYDPNAGRFIHQDPIGLEGGANVYRYTQDPVNWIDPTGFTAKDCRLPGRSGALNEAKRDLGIPRSQHPESVSRVPMTKSDGSWIVGENGKPIMTREYTYKRPDGSSVVIQDHYAGHQFGEGGIGDQGAHFNVRPPENTRTGSVPGQNNIIYLIDSYVDSIC
ncbi:RHS repeat-associated core domain-containing protein [Methylomonas rosea]|uniref:HNH/endonuclease VII fold putative polymorphic toxin n=1 Tax=Methylomonas rosea TaxID=2952227 RepID=A0ABT1TUX9_9GAMM|nr:RHS repeat-associated core domain-containing protein [Methylomonas sp. WSC-7]MCQ8117888.1 HNH/endonuclease VII fold putative polymorphic toxin [Methylomonas sp. WSC-7]